MPKLVGMNHIALEVGDLDEALAFWESIFDGLDLRGRVGNMAFIDMGDQFLALSQGRRQEADKDRHFGLVVDDREAVRAALVREGAEILPGQRLNFRDPWGNHLQVVDYRAIQFTKAPAVLASMGLEGLAKRPSALPRAKGWR